MDPTLRTNTSEVDQIVWLHSLKSCAQKVLIFSPDTDVYHIGLPAKTEMVQNCDIMIQLSKHMKDAKFIHLNALFSALESDPDLVMIPKDQRPQVLQTTNICTGSDYTLFFQWIGKISFLATFSVCRFYYRQRNDWFIGEYHY